MRYTNKLILMDLEETQDKLKETLQGINRQIEWIKKGKIPD